MPRPKVSIMVSVYNQLHCMGKALQSAIDQSYENIEIVIGDDASTDGDVKAFVERFASEKVKYFRNSPNLGVSGNYGKLIGEYASGDLCLMLNADDYFTDLNYIEKAVTLFEKDPEVVLVFGDARKYIESKDEFISDDCNQELEEINDGNEFFLNYWKGYSLPHNTCLYDRKRAIALDFYNDESISDDLESLFRLVIGCKVGYVNENVAVMVKHQSNFTKATDYYFQGFATNFIEKPYLYAKEKGNIDLQKLDKWRKKMLKRYHLKVLVKLHYLAPERVEEYEKKVLAELPELSGEILGDLRYKGFLMIKRVPWLLRLGFRLMFKQESFIADLQQVET